MRVYLSVPMISNRSLDRAKLMADAVVRAGHEVSSPWVLGSVEGAGGRVDVFERDKRGAEECDCLLADVSQPSTGVGMEIMAAHKSGKRILLVAKRGSSVSRMLLHMKGKDLLEFEDEAALTGLIAGALALDSGAPRRGQSI